MVLSWKCSRFGPFQFLSRQWQSIQIIYIIMILVIYIIIYTNHIFSNSYQLNFDKKKIIIRAHWLRRAYLIWQNWSVILYDSIGRDTRSVFKRKKYKQQRKRSTTKNVINSFYEFYFLSLILSSLLSWANSTSQSLEVLVIFVA